MFMSRRKLLGLLPAVYAPFIPASRAMGKTARTSRSVLRYEFHDEVSVRLLKTYARSLALADNKARWEAQMMFHEAQLSRQRCGDTLPQILGYRHNEFVEAHEQGRPIDRSHPAWQKTYSRRAILKRSQDRRRLAERMPSCK
jgi:hypothetical protein